MLENRRCEKCREKIEEEGFRMLEMGAPRVCESRAERVP
jgi:hypothetical protein